MGIKQWGMQEDFVSEFQAPIFTYLLYQNMPFQVKNFNFLLLTPTFCPPIKPILLHSSQFSWITPVVKIKSCVTNHGQRPVLCLVIRI